MDRPSARADLASSAWAILRNRHFLLLWLVTITTTLAIELFSVTVLVAIFEQTESTLQAAGVMVARTLPALLLGPVAGASVDRFPRKNVLIGMDALRVLLVGVAIRFSLGKGEVSVTGIYLIVAGLSAAGILHQPARLALIPSFVTKEHLIRANSFVLASTQIIMALSYTIGGWLILALPLVHIALGVVVLLAIAVLTAMLMATPKRQSAGHGVPSEPFWRSVVSGWGYLWKHPLARPLTVMETVEHLPHGIWTGALMLAFTRQALQGDVVDWGYQITGYFAGTILGSLGALAIGGWLGRHPGRIIITNACAAGVLTLGFASSQTVWMAVALSFLFGPPNAIRDVAQDSLLQSTVDGGQLGRVYATRGMLASAVVMFAGIFFAWLSEAIPIRLVYVTGGIIYLLTALYGLSSRALRESRMEARPAVAD